MVRRPRVPRADGEVDLYRFRIDEAGRYVLETSGPTDVVMSIHGPDNDASLAGTDDDSGLDLNARIERDLAVGKYLVQVRHYNPRGRGGYELALEHVGGPA